MGLKVLGRVGTHSKYYIFLKKNSGKKLQFYAIWKAILPFKMHKIIFLPENLKKV